MNLNSILSTVAFVAVFIVCLMGPIAAFAAGPAPVNLLSAGSFTILTKTGITDTGSHTTVIRGAIGSSPITAAAMNTVFCSQVTGVIYGVDAAYIGNGNAACFAGNPPSANKTLIDNAVLDMGTAYADASGRTNPDATELGAGSIGGLTISPGLYAWSGNVTIPTDVTLSGGENDVWIFQIAGNLDVASAGNLAAGAKVILAGGARAENIFWQVGGISGATLGTHATFNGTILSAKQVIIQTGAVLNGRAFAGTQVTLDGNAVTFPAPAHPHGVLAVTSVQAIDTSGTADDTFENGWRYAFDVTVPDNETGVAMKFADWTAASASSSVAVANNMRISSAQADNAGAAIPLAGAGIYSSPMLRMTGDLDSFLPGLQVRILLETKIPLNTPGGSYSTRYGIRTAP